MARKPNYAFERNNRAKAKAAKREAKRRAKLDAKSRIAEAEVSLDENGQAADAGSRLGSYAPPESGRANIRPSLGQNPDDQGT